MTFGTQWAAKSWQTGPYELVGEHWFDNWYQFAEDHFHRASSSSALDKLRTVVESVAETAFGDQHYWVNDLEVVRTAPDLFQISAKDVFNAVFDLSNNLLRLSLTAHAETPRVTLGNALRGAISIALPLQFDGLMFHASSGILDNHGVFFPGISTAGKTTLALGFEKVTYLSDDVTLTRDLVNQPTLSASPFFGIAGRKGANAEAPLDAVGVLVRKHPNKTAITRLSEKAALQELMRHAICWGNDAGLHAAILSNVHSLVQQVPVFAVERYLGDSSDVITERVLSAANV